MAEDERFASIGRLAAGIAHEINNPAAVIRHDLELILKGSPDSPKLAKHALASLDHIVHVVRRLLDVGLASRPGTGDLAPFSLAPVIARAVDTLASRFPSGALIVDIDPALVAIGDPARLEHVLASVLSNAAYAVASSTKPTVLVRGVRDGDRIRLSVVDNGAGIPADILGRLFEPFVNARPFGQGAGLGLAVSHGLMRSQNGALRLVRTSAEGTEMAIDLPLSSADVIAPIAETVTKFADAPLTLLIIDDDAELRAVLKAAAEAQRFHPVVAATVADAFAVVDGGRAIDIVLCDLMMPDGGAETWLRTCHARHPLLASRTIIITGGPSSSDAVAFADANADRLLYKPFAMSTVRAMARRLIGEFPDPKVRGS